MIDMTNNTDQINEMARAICVDQDINAIVPPDAPCLWVSRDKSGHTASSLVDVWTRAPKRMLFNRGTAPGFTTYEYIDGGTGEQSTLLGRFSTSQILERFGLVPCGDECIAFDNASVN